VIKNYTNVARGNKVASAKYRTKKTYRNENISKTIDGLTKANMFLLGHLEEIKAENSELKEMVDMLESELVEGGQTYRFLRLQR